MLKHFYIHPGYFTFFLLTVINTLSAQIPINGFCKYVNVTVDSSFGNVLPLNFNGDSYTDLLLYNQSNKIISYQGKSDYNFVKSNTTNLRFEISVIKPINRKLVNNQYAFLSRKNRRVGILEVTAYGYCRIISELKIDSYPEDLSIADVNKDGVEEFLVSGNSFDGLSVFYISNRDLIERKLLSKRLFSHSVFVELNNDVYPDIAAIDLIQNKLIFFYNNSAGNYYEARSFSFNSKLTLLHVLDFNLDGYHDVCVAGKDKIEILLGDPYSKYDRKISTNTSYQPQKLVTADFNNDGLIDIAYIDKLRSIVSVFYSDEKQKFYPEVSYLQKPGLNDLTLFYSKFVNGIMSYSSAGKLHIIDRLRRITDSTSLVFGINPSTLKYFDAGNDKIYDFSFFDREKVTLNLVVRNSSGIPEKLYRIKLESSCRNLLVDETGSAKKTFYCYSNNSRLIEIISVDFRDNSVNKDKFYSVGPIADVRVKRNPDEDRAKIYILSNKNNNLILSIVYYKDFRYSVSNSNVLAKSIWNAKLSLEDQTGIYYWTNENNTFIFEKIVVNNDLNLQQKVFSYKLESTDVRSIAMLVGDIFNRDENDAISFVRSSDKKDVIFSTGSNNYKLKLDTKMKRLNLNDESLFNLFEMRFNGLNKLFAISQDSKTLNKLELLFRKKSLNSTELVEAENIQSYFIKNLNFKNYHFVYIDKSEHCITIKEIA